MCSTSVDYVDLWLGDDTYCVLLDCTCFLLSRGISALNLFRQVVLASLNFIESIGNKKRMQKGLDA